jgi:UTP--glucose-1-phosphate uridylyltransferase
LVVNRIGEIPAIRQCIDVFNRNDCSVLGVQNVTTDQTNRYGIIGYNEKLNSNYICRKIVEKPKSNPPSNLAIMGRYVFKYSIISNLERVEINQKGEIELTEAINSLITQEKVLATVFKGTRYDIGSKVGFVKAIIDRSLEHKETKDEIYNFLRSIPKKTINE